MNDRALPSILRSGPDAGRLRSLLVVLLASVGGCDGGAPPPNVPPAEVVKLPLLTMVKVPAGSFLMGSPEGAGLVAEYPQRRVMVPKPFLIGRTEVTREEYMNVLGRGKDTEGTKPMSGVRWYDAIEFCNELSKREGLEPAYELEVRERDDVGGVVRASVRRIEGNGYRLPSEAEWEYACRAGSDSLWCFGDDPQDLYEYGWFEGHAVSSPQPVASLAPNFWGIHDMHGNLWEWVEDPFKTSYQGAPADSRVWDENGNGLGARGGGYLGSSDLCRSAYRNRGLPGQKGGVFGFRVAMDAPEDAGAGSEGGSATESRGVTGGE